MSIQKKVVHYNCEPNFYMYGGAEIADVIPLDHPDTRNVTNGKVAHTSTVISKVVIDNQCLQFETKNTIYIRKVD